MKKLALLFALALLCVVSVKAQNVSPLGATGFQQYFANDGTPLVGGALYFYVAGSTTQAPTYTDAGGQTLNPNPLPLTTGGRVNAWLVTTQQYKILLCASSTDGPFCSPGNVLAVADQVPGGSAGGGSGSCATGCVGFFISGTASPATSGVLRCASGDQCLVFRNAAGSANLALTKSANDILTWAGGSVLFPEIGAPSGVAGNDLLYADNTAHRWKMINNAGTAAQVVASGVDISTTDSVSALHFGSTQTPLCSTAPTTGQFIQWTGTNLCGGGGTAYNTTISESAASVPSQTMVATTPSSATNYVITFHISQTAVWVGCTGNPTLALQIVYTDAFTNASRTVNVLIAGDSSTYAGVATFQGTLGSGADWYTGPELIRAQPSTSITYSGTYGPGSGCSTGASYSVAPVVTQN